RLAVLAGVDAAGHVWASLVTGNPGFITAPSSRTLRLAARLSDVDPLTDGLSSDRPLGLLVIDPERRRRLRVNGRVIRADRIATDPRVGLLFVAFDTGTTLQLAGRARILWEVADRAGLPGAERAVEVEVDEVVEIAGQGPLGWRFVEYSPFNPR